MRRHIPNIITLLNLASGFTALIFIINGEPVTASWFVAAAMVFDFCDGMAARVLKAYSEMGKQLDSLADMVSFGAVPGVLVYSITTAAENEWLRVGVALLLPLFAALRLAKFNIDEEQKDEFKGLPTPAAALAIISLILASHHGSHTAMMITGNITVLFIWSAAIAFMMVVPLRMMSLKFRSLGIRENFYRYLLILLSLGAIIMTGFGGLFLIIPFYILISLSALVSR
ncbi:MAG: CDP-diacylglycerol--serine O-phosphatidyltransferase [Bacteroidales bacterium]|nr:CDP-diacylglycerol--serine O-phosphatidyltransferase [Bacteroidales bacterium]